MKHVVISGSLMQIIDILRDEGEVRHIAGHCRNRSMSGVRLCAKNESAAPFIPPPYQGGVAHEGAGSREFSRGEVFPQSGLFVAECGDTTFGRDAGSGEDDDSGGRAEGFYDSGVDDAGRIQFEIAFILYR